MVLASSDHVVRVSVVSGRERFLEARETIRIDRLLRRNSGVDAISEADDSAHRPRQRLRVKGCDMDPAALVDLSDDRCVDPRPDLRDGRAGRGGDDRLGMEVRREEEREAAGDPRCENAFAHVAVRFQLGDLMAHRLTDSIVAQRTGQQQHCCG